MGFTSPNKAGLNLCIGASITSAVAFVERLFRTAHERRKLLALDDRALKDMGVSRADAFREGSRWFWDLPKKT